MSDELKEQLEQFAAEQAETKASLEETQAQLTTATAEIQELKAQLAELEVEPAVEEEPDDEDAEESADDVTDDYAEKLAAMQEDFDERLNTEKAAREKAEEAFADERNTRRMAEFTDKVAAFSFGTDGVEQFAEDLMAIEDHDPELYGRMLTRFNAINEQMASGELFAQHSMAGGEAEETEPFLRDVEKVRKERFSDQPYAEGFTAAMDIVSSESPDLARNYAEQH